MKFFKEITDNTKELTYRIISGLISSFLFTNILPIFMFIIYMKENAFFSYDFFTGGLFGLNIFFLFSMIVISMFIFSLTSSLFFITGLIIKKWTKIEIESEFILFTIIFATLNILLLYISFYTSKDKVFLDYLIYFSYIGVVISIHFGVVVFAKAKYSLLSLLISFVIIVSIFLADSPKTADIVTIGLKIFNSGSKNIVIKNRDNNRSIIKGEMILLSPDNVFINVREKENNTTVMTIIKRDNIIIDIKN